MKLIRSSSFVFCTSHSKKQLFYVLIRLVYFLKLYVIINVTLVSACVLEPRHRALARGFLHRRPTHTHTHTCGERRIIGKLGQSHLGTS